MMGTMQRAVLYKEKDLRIEECPIPEIGDDEVLVRNMVSTTCGTDVKIYKRGYPLLKPPHPFGHEFSGVIAAAGKSVKGFREGDRVAVHNSAPCNRCWYCKNDLQSMCQDLMFNRGAYAEYVRVPGRIVRQNMFRMPDSMSHKTASLMEPLSCAVYGIANCPIETDDTVVVNGAGPIGLMFVKLCALKGAKVIVTDLSESRLATARILGAADTIAVTGNSDIAEEVRKLTEDQRGADVVIEATGLVKVWEDSIRMVRKGGFVLFFGGTSTGSSFKGDANLMHYSQVTLKGVFHTTPLHVMKAFNLLKEGHIDSDVFIQDSYRLADLEKAIIEHSNQKVVKNYIDYTL